MANIQWFPGHMNKARKDLAICIDKVDAVLEIVDARAPQSSRSPLLAEICDSKPLIILLNKCDLADRSMVTQWVSFFKGHGGMALPISAKNSAGLPILRGRLHGMILDKRVSAQVRRWVIVGVPNSGKSTLINLLSRKKRAKTASVPGVTRELTVYKLGDGLELIDSPGTLCHKFEDQMVAARLAALGLIKEGIYSAYDVLEMIYPYLYEHYGVLLCKRHNVEQLLDVQEFVELIAKRLNKPASDIEAVARHILRDLREGNYGAVCLERPQDIKNNNDDIGPILNEKPS